MKNGVSIKILYFYALACQSGNEKLLNVLLCFGLFCFYWWGKKHCLDINLKKIPTKANLGRLPENSRPRFP